jgi:PPE-repeat protein
MRIPHRLLTVRLLGSAVLATAFFLGAPTGAWVDDLSIKYATAKNGGSGGGSGGSGSGSGGSGSGGSGSGSSGSANSGHGSAGTASADVGEGATSGHRGANAGPGSVNSGPGKAGVASAHHRGEVEARGRANEPGEDLRSAN